MSPAKFLKSSLIFTAILVTLNSCAFSGRAKDEGVVKFVTGEAKVEAWKNVHIINLMRAIGSPSSSITIDKFKYYRWDYTRTFGVSTIFGGASTTFYCSFSAETHNNKVKLLNWYGNQCDIFLDPVKDYFQNKLDIEVISEDDIKQQTITTGTISSQGIEQKQKMTVEQSEAGKEKIIKPEAATPIEAVKPTISNTEIKS